MYLIVYVCNSRAFCFHFSVDHKYRKVHGAEKEEAENSVAQMSQQESNASLFFINTKLFLDERLTHVHIISACHELYAVTHSHHNG